MTKFLSLMLFGFVFVLSSCNTQAGKTLSVHLNENVPRSVPVGVAFTDSAAFAYRGTQSDLGFRWEVVSSTTNVDNVGFTPVTGTVSATAGGVTTSMTFATTGTYVIKVTVYELNSSISSSDTATYIVNAGSG
jgi:hypothetical protein